MPASAMIAASQSEAKPLSGPIGRPTWTCLGAGRPIMTHSNPISAVAGPVLSAAVVELMGNNYRWLWPVSGVYVLLAWIALNGVKKKVVE